MHAVLCSIRHHVFKAEHTENRIGRKKEKLKVVTWEAMEKSLVGNKVEGHTWKESGDCVSIIQA